MCVPSVDTQRNIEREIEETASESESVNAVVCRGWSLELDS